MKPTWLRRKLPDPKILQNMRDLLARYKLYTVCQGALCPNQGECFGHGTATFLILGQTCTRNCTFCAITSNSTPPAPDPEEPERLAQAVQELGLKYVVITSVTRDDLPDGGAGHFAQTVATLKGKIPEIKVEVLIPDFQGSMTSLKKVLESDPDIINHNLETVPRLYPEVRPQADYQRSLNLLRAVKETNPLKITKSGIMLGLGERREEIFEAMQDLLTVSCDLLTLGQYLQPSGRHHPVIRYISPTEFEEYKKAGEEMGFKTVFAGPLVRSSFHARKIFQGLEGKR